MIHLPPVLPLVAVLLVVGCSNPPPPPPPPTPPTPLPGKVVTYTSRPRVDLSASGLPTLANGNTRLVEVPGVRLEHDGRLKDSLTALGACVDEVIGCVSPDERSLDDCFRSVRSCSTNEPWNEDACCPVACLEGYGAQRAAGMAEFDAFRQTLFVEKTCMPGLTEILAGGRR